MIYLAAPYSGTEEEIAFRVKEVNKLYLSTIKQGVAMFSPLSASHYLNLENPLPWEDWIRYDLEMLKLSNHLLVYCLPGWKQSKGVALEIETAKELGISISYLAYHPVG